MVFLSNEINLCEPWCLGGESCFFIATKSRTHKGSQSTLKLHYKSKKIKDTGKKKEGRRGKN